MGKKYTFAWMCKNKHWRIINKLMVIYKRLKAEHKNWVGYVVCLSWPIRPLPTGSLSAFYLVSKGFMPLAFSSIQWMGIQWQKRMKSGYLLPTPFPMKWLLTAVSFNRRSLLFQSSFPSGRRGSDSSPAVGPVIPLQSSHTFVISPFCK